MDQAKFCSRCWDWSNNCTKVDCPFSPQAGEAHKEIHPRFSRDTLDWFKLNEEFSKK